VCECRFELDRGDSQEALKAVNGAFAEVMELANLYDPESELSQLNAQAHIKPFVCSQRLYGLLCESRKAYELSSGSFDISVKPLMDLWGFYRKQGKIPPEADIAEAKLLCGLDKIVFNDAERTVKFPRRGMALDLGGIAKGFALDLAVEKLAQKNISVRRGTINLGGNIYLLGRGESYRIGIKDPSAPEKIKDVITLKAPGAVSSSGDYERFVILEGKKFGHIIDPDSGFPAARNYAATVFASSGVKSDWMSTTLYLRGKDFSSSLDCQSWIVEK
jgi:thiamine biosynthesis lipoprotein